MVAFKTGCSQTDNYLQFVSFKTYIVLDIIFFICRILLAFRNEVQFISDTMFINCEVPAAFLLSILEAQQHACRQRHEASTLQWTIFDSANEIDFQIRIRLPSIAPKTITHTII